MRISWGQDKRILANSTKIYTVYLLKKQIENAPILHI